MNSYPTWQQPPVPDFMPYLEGAAQIIREHEITLDEDGILDNDDVDISSLGNGKFLKYNSTTKKLEFTDEVGTYTFS